MNRIYHTFGIAKKISSIKNKQENKFPCLNQCTGITVGRALITVKKATKMKYLTRVLGVRRIEKGNMSRKEIIKTEIRERITRTQSINTGHTYDRQINRKK